MSEYDADGKVTQFEIDRKTWLRGHKDGDGQNAGSLLLNATGQRCCLGHYCRAVGIKDDIMDRQAALSNVIGVLNPPLLPDQVEWLLDRTKEDNSRIAYEIMMLNDTESKSDEEREKRLARFFVAQGIKVVFVN